VLLRQFQGGGLLVDAGVVQMLDRHAFFAGLGFGVPGQTLCELLGMLVEIDVLDFLLVQIPVHAPGIVQHPRLPAKTKTVKTRKNQADECPKSC
jgi:hypothetical protein